VSVCHCLDCQRRSGSAFSAQARWRAEQVTVVGETKTWERIADSGHRATYSFCPHCGSTVAYVIEGWPGVVAIPLGALQTLHSHGQNFQFTNIGGMLGLRCSVVMLHSSTPNTVRSPGMDFASATISSPQLVQ
jgi:hypothetical protein